METILSKRLKSLRIERDKSQKEVVRDLSLNQTTLSGYENGYRELKFEMLNKFAQYYGVTVDYLTGNSNYENDIQKSLSGALADILGVTPESISERMDLFDRFFDIIKVSTYPYLSTGANFEELTEHLKVCMESLLDYSLHSIKETYLEHEAKKAAMQSGNFESIQKEITTNNRGLYLMILLQNLKNYTDNLQIRSANWLESLEQKDDLKR
jgi:transcriptional regulator with XRE-family HTH domain